MNKGKLGILVGGGPAPGLNGVIHAATIEAINNGLEVVGIYEGFKYLMEGKVNGTPLTIESVSRIHQRGGSIIRTSRANPTKKEDWLANCVHALLDEGITYLLALGGDDTAFSAYSVSRYAKEHMGVNIQVAHAPKTIDNDLPLPKGIPTFGFETARALGASLVSNLMEDALTGQRWYLVVAMGRKAGHLALGIGKSAGATLTLIPEEWRRREIRMQEVVDILTMSVLKRLADDKPYGVFVVAEGFVEYMSETELAALKDVPRDSHGHILLSEVDFSRILTTAVRAELKKLGIDMRIVSKDLGYELRCAPPSAYDIDYTRTLGESAVEFLLNGGSHATITVQQGEIVPISFDTMMDPETGRTEVRIVDIDGGTYKSAYKFMVRLKPPDAEDPILLADMVNRTNLTLDQFKERYGYLIEIAPCPF
ncbi:MAG: 6-phosphofructokinase [Anaerolineae bacterium]|nr:6-phosphofructokinase [Anaerolineae bacterium]